jgi:mRNA interferase YafQ
VNIHYTRIFIKQVKKLHKRQKTELDNAVKKIMQNYQIGEAKKGDLHSVRVYKFSMNGQLTLIAYTFQEADNMLLLISFGVHENFYRDLKKQAH